MSTSQGELGKRVVEGSWKPGGSGMTQTTIRSKLTFVSIVFSMAGETGCIKGGENIIEMTFGTFQAGMGTSQRELRL